MHQLAIYLAQFEPVLIDALITALAPLAVVWIVSHIKLKNAQAKQVISDLLTSVILRGKVFVSQTAVTETLKVGDFDTGNTRVDAVANYAAKMAPQVLKQAGIDVTTEGGQAALAARIVATIPAPAPIVIAAPITEEQRTAALNTAQLKKGTP